MKKKNFTITAIILSLLIAVLPLPLHASNSPALSTRTVGNLEFSNCITDEEIADISEDELMILEREAVGPIISTSTLPYLSAAQTYSRYDSLSTENPPQVYDLATLRITITRMPDYEAAYGDRPAFKFIFTVSLNSGKAFNANHPDFIGLSWNSGFHLIPGTQTAYTAYRNEISGSSGFDYNCATQDDIGYSGVSFKIDISVYDYLVVETAEVYATSSAGNDVAVGGVYVSCEKTYSLSDATFTVSIPPAFSFGINSSIDDESMTVYATTTYV